MAYDDDDDGPGFLTTAVLLSLAAGGAWLLYKTLSGQAQAATPGDGTTGASAAGGGITGGASSILSDLTNLALPRGVRNNNPLNIKYNAANNWDGQTGQDSAGYAMFSDPSYGLRAGIMILQTYQGEISPYDIPHIGARWTSGDSPAKQAAWISTVSAVSGYPQNAPLSPYDATVISNLIPAMIAAENGQQYAGQYASALAQAQQMAA
jgi:hypothetical protein